MSVEEYHIPVLLDEVLGHLLKKRAGIYVDCTLGGGGHFRAIASKLSKEGTLIGIDRDREAIEYNRKKLFSESNPRIVIEQSRFSEFDRVLETYGITQVDGFLLDLGVSSRQIDSKDRGFSYKQQADLDMRMDPGSGISAREVLQQSSEEQLSTVLYQYGEIKNAQRMARAIKQWMKNKEIRTSSDLKQCIEHEYGINVKFKVLSKLFQALRIAVNGELEELQIFLNKSMKYLSAPGGRLAVISYHSLEDRIVKQFIRSKEGRCVCPSSLPVCVCNEKKQLKRVNRKAIVADEQQIAFNPRARSARLRVVEKVA
ncbi:16S rRNA (cytosine(1402)-N(4))-methyltransferase RsmH [Chitinispirillales bacterium ANBcel5]|uniref:16S rRNA (cytosine(1402)-N(4))-methyltransferase RsmH n=1 Tax=Cellulosispirillum alkaliphilum TaxID=3039283 RepID=UPI002A55A806|nr:16S rRNA (cytosine(1402)-N(4))-methyltransferase RsmH [Chitinispirillales bacterium ANBcel5]